MASAIRVSRRGAVLAFLVALTLPAAAFGQERDARRDTAAVAPDTAAVVPDTAAVAPDTLAPALDSVAIVALDSAVVAAQEDTVPKRVPSFPARYTIPDSLTTAEVYEWDLQDLLAVPAWSLLDLLTFGLPGMTPIRVGFFSGAHQMLDGVFGPGFVVVRRNGRVMPPLESAQLDLASIPLVTLESVRVIRRSNGLELELEEKRQVSPIAYARITVATGDPSLELLRGLFTNGFGTALTVGFGIDLLNVSPELQESNQLHFFGLVNWMPFNNRSGLELVWHNERIERAAAETLKADRNSLVLRARADVSDHFQVEVHGSTSSLNVDEASAAGEDSTLTDVDEAAMTLRGRFGRGYANGGGSVASGVSLPNLSGWAEAGYGLLPGLVLEAGGAVSSWDKFSTAFGRLGVAWSLNPGFGLELRADGSVGKRGLPRPLEGRTDSVTFTGFAAGATEQFGQFRFGQRLVYQDLSRQLPFGAPFDRALVLDITNVQMPAVELTYSGPVIPVGAIIRGWNPIRLEGFFRYNFVPSGKNLIYTPERVAYGAFTFDQAFLQDNLKVHLGLFVVHRGNMLSAIPGAPNPAPAGSLTQVGFELWAGIQTFRFWFRVDDMNRQIVQDVVGTPYPKDRFSLGVKWEFLN